MVALQAEELLAWVERTSQGWRELITEHPDVLSIPCDIRETSSVAGLVQHIVAVELRYAQRLRGLPESPYEEISMCSAAELYATHDKAVALLRPLLSRPDVAWEQRIEFATRSAGILQVTRRVVLVHLLMHSIRHYAQLATLVRQHGIKPNWPMDYLFMGV